jgi:hypothetical protein
MNDQIMAKNVEVTNSFAWNETHKHRKRIRWFYNLRYLIMTQRNTNMDYQVVKIVEDCRAVYEIHIRAKLKATWMSEDAFIFFRYFSHVFIFVRVGFRMKS